MAKPTNLAIRKNTLNAVRDYVTIQGELMYATNHLQEQFFRLFGIAISLSRPPQVGVELAFMDHALALWHVIKNDMQQREMALVAISTVPTNLKLKSVITRLDWIKKEAGNLTHYRNLAAHNPVMFRGKYDPKTDRVQFLPSFGGYSTRPISQAKFNQIKGLRLWRLIRDDLLKLGDYLRVLNDQIRRLHAESEGKELMGVPSTWPDRPRLRSLSRLSELDNLLNLATPKPKRRRQRRSWRA